MRKKEEFECPICHQKGFITNTIKGKRCLFCKKTFCDSTLKTEKGVQDGKGKTEKEH